MIDTKELISKPTIYSLVLKHFSNITTKIHVGRSLPTPREGQALFKTEARLVSAGTERRSSNSQR